MNERIYSIGEVADILDRVPHTIRIWSYKGILPKQLEPHRDERGWRYWTEDQVEGLKIWVVESDLRPGKGLPTVKNKE